MTRRGWTTAVIVWVVTMTALVVWWVPWVAHAGTVQGVCRATNVYPASYGVVVPGRYEGHALIRCDLGGPGSFRLGVQRHIYYGPAGGAWVYVDATDGAGDPGQIDIQAADQSETLDVWHWNVTAPCVAADYRTRFVNLLTGGVVVSPESTIAC